MLRGVTHSIDEVWSEAAGIRYVYNKVFYIEKHN